MKDRLSFFRFKSSSKGDSLGLDSSSSRKYSEPTSRTSWDSAASDCAVVSVTHHETVLREKEEEIVCLKDKIRSMEETIEARVTEIDKCIANLSGFRRYPPGHPGSMDNSSRGDVTDGTEGSEATRKKRVRFVDTLDTKSDSDDDEDDEDEEEDQQEDGSGSNDTTTELDSLSNPTKNSGDIFSSSSNSVTRGILRNAPVFHPGMDEYGVETRVENLMFAKQELRKTIRKMVTDRQELLRLKIEQLRQREQLEKTERDWMGATLRAGAPFLKYDSRSTHAAPRYFTCNTEDGALRWSKTRQRIRRADSILNMVHVRSLAYGPRSPAFFSNVSYPAAPWLCLVLFTSKRRLELIATTEEDAITWFLGLQSQVSHPLHRQLTRGTLLWRKAMMKLRAAAYSDNMRFSAWMAQEVRAASARLGRVSHVNVAL